eukprot:SAG31_NODE_5116_length_2731_cov_1.876900_3_plen_298_part_00
MSAARTCVRRHDCMSPPHCPASSYQNRLAHFGGMYCGCERGNTTVGRVDMATAFGHHHSAPPPPPATSQRQLQSSLSDEYWTCSQAVTSLCSGGYPPVAPDKCMQCAADHQAALHQAKCSNEMIQHSCSANFDSCKDELYRSKCSPMAGSASCKDCAGAHTAVLEAANCTTMYVDYACSSHHHNWVDLGGYWYNTQADGECEGEAMPGDGSGCSWKVLETMKYANESCVNAHIDLAVETAGVACFENCSQPKNASTDCYQQCYSSTLSGNAAADPPVKPMAHEDLLTPWCGPRAPHR